MDWKLVAAKLASAGLPLLAKIIGGEIERIPIVGSFIDGPDVIMRIGRQAIALALGVDPTPEAIGKAIDEKPTSEVLPTLQGVENGLAEKYQALADIVKSDNASDIDLARVNSENYRARLAAEVATNSFWQSLYRPIGLWASTGAFMYLVGLILVAATWGGSIRENVVAMETILYSLLASLVGILFGHFLTRAQERKAALNVTLAPIIAPAVVPAVTPAKPVKR